MISPRHSSNKTTSVPHRAIHHRLHKPNHLIDTWFIPNRYSRFRRATYRLCRSLPSAIPARYINAIQNLPWITLPINSIIIYKILSLHSSFGFLFPRFELLNLLKRCIIIFQWPISFEILSECSVFGRAHFVL